MIRRITICTLTVLCLSWAASADVPNLNLSTAELATDATGVGVTVVPDGSWARFDEAFDMEGNSVDATITLTLVDDSGIPIQGFPREDIWLETSLGSLSSCIYGSSPDHDTDENGQTIWLEPLHAGGCTVGEVTVVFVSGSPLQSGDLDLVFRSFDYNGDLAVNLTDIVVFTQSIGTDFECNDFNNDGVVNLVDIVRITSGIGATCPE